MRKEWDGRKRAEREDAPVVRLDRYRRGNGVGDLGDEQALGARVFGDPESAIELMELLGTTGSRVVEGELYIRALSYAENALAIDLLRTRFAAFESYDDALYERFLFAAALRFRAQLEIGAMLRVVGLARHLFRFRYGLPRMDDWAAERRLGAGSLGRLRLWWRNRKVERAIEEFASETIRS